MNQDQTNIVQDNQIAAAPVVNRKTESRKTGGNKEAEIIKPFLESLGQYEAAALRLSIALAEIKTSVAGLGKEEKLSLNRFFNLGMNREHPTSEALQAHRMQRAFALVNRASAYCDKAQMLRLNQSLVMMAVDSNTIAETIKMLETEKRQSNPTAGYTNPSSTTNKT